MWVHTGFVQLNRTEIVNVHPTGGKFPAPLDVLVVDDEPLIRWSLKRGLSKRGHRVAEAGNGQDALRQIEADPQQFDVIVLDYRLPDVQHLDLLEQIRRLAPATAILMMTAYGEPATRERAIALGARVVIDKPFQVSDVVSLVESPPPMTSVPFLPHV
jgi:two-component system response regulator (stage 0 sporulation protein F)